MNVKVNLERQIQVAEDEIITSLSTIDKVYNILDVDRTAIMETYSQELLEKYEQNNDFSTWNYKQLEKESGMQIFIINGENEIIESSYQDDVGLNFDECCKNFGKLLTERRQSGIFSHDALDVQQNTGEFKKFTYMPTPDGEYLIELAYNLEDKIEFQEFNFIDTTLRLEEENDQIKSINVYTSLGLLLGDRQSEREEKIAPSREAVFKEAFRDFEVKEKISKENGQVLTYRYIPYRAEKAEGLSTNRVVEIAYYDVPVAGVLVSYRNEFIYQIIAISMVTIILSIIIARMISRPVHLAFHDVLTGLKNRAAFEDSAVEWLRRKKGPLQFMIIDLDNFKLVNDSLGHGEGDRLLRQAAKIIEKESGSENLSARIGGDEFVVLFSRLTEEEVKERAENMLGSMRDCFSYLEKDDIHLSISIGIAIADTKDTMHTLYHKADVALYHSKKKGKDQYSLYHYLET
ncbi:hypothetical protein NCCP2331_26190 [Sporosarcina sp. NCCP-2331]|nr:hypothetical protein NCCP2331_26190 [Sporosarcina sp. NCCP-2331]GLB56670.1 hypothetical protein NCCP2378_24570 [Sporosarcina sp. NCCP-2378]